MKISKNVPLPENNAGRPNKYDFDKLNIGDSFPITKAERLSVYSCVVSYNKLNSKTIKIKTGKDNKGQLRCWRVA